MTNTAIPEGISPIAVPGNRYPTGWFQVAWSDDIGTGEVKALHYFGRDLAVWRGESGRLYASDAHCLHLGAHLGIGGEVEGENVVCPWHAWRWSGEGRNTFIPDSVQSCKEKLRLEVFAIEERYGIVLVWHDVAKRPPLWEVPVLDELEGDEWYPITPEMRVVHRLKVHPQLVLENGADPIHVKYVHGAGEVPDIQTYEFDGPKFRADVVATYGAGKESTWLTPNGPVEAALEFNWIGGGQGWVRWPDVLIASLQLTNVTPIDDTYSDYWFCMTTKKESPEATAPSEALMKFVKHQMYTIEQDFPLWENMKVGVVPHFSPEEAPHYSALRRWAWQFYPNQGPVGTGATTEDSSTS